MQQPCDQSSSKNNCQTVFRRSSATTSGTRFNLSNHDSILRRAVNGHEKGYILKSCRKTSLMSSKNHKRAQNILRVENWNVTYFYITENCCSLTVSIIKFLLLQLPTSNRLWKLDWSLYELFLNTSQTIWLCIQATLDFPERCITKYEFRHSSRLFLHVATVCKCERFTCSIKTLTWYGWNNENI